MHPQHTPQCAHSHHRAPQLAPSNSQPGRYLYVAPSGRIFTSKKAAEAARDQEEIMMLRCDEQIDDLTEQIDSPVLAEALHSLYRASSTVHTKKRKSVFGGGSTMAMTDEDWTPLVAHPLPKTVAPTQPASPRGPVAHSSTRKIRTVAWEEHSKPKHVLDEDMLDEGECVAVAADPGAQLPWSFWQARHSGSAARGSLTSSLPLSAPSLPSPLRPPQLHLLAPHPLPTFHQASTADIELMLLEEHHALHSPARAPHSGRESPLNLKLVSDSHSSDLAKFMTAEPLPVSHPSPTFIGHNFIGELSCSPAKPAQGTCSTLVQAAKDANKAATVQASAVTGPRKVVKAEQANVAKKAEQAKAAFCTLSKALKGGHAVAVNARPRTSQYRGVSKRESGRWTARMKLNNRDIVIGRFDTELAAAHAYDKARLKCARPGSHVRPELLNFPAADYSEGGCEADEPPSKPRSAKASPVTCSPPKRKAAAGHEAAGEAAGHGAQTDDLGYQAAQVYIPCCLADGCILAERHAGLCIVPEPEGRRNRAKRRAEQTPPSLRAQHEKVERIGLKLTGMGTWAASS